MMRTNNRLIRIRLKEILQTIFKNAHYMKATDVVPYPYITYEYKMKYNGNKGIGILEIDVWDENSDSEKVEEIADDLENGLNELIYTDEYMILKFYTNTRTPVLDDDKDIQRRMLVFEMQYYSGKG